MTRTARFREADLTRAVKAAEKIGLSVARIRIEPDGAIEIYAGEPQGDNSNWFAGGPLYRDAAA